MLRGGRMKKYAFISLCLIFIIPILVTCKKNTNPNFRIAVAQFSHETCTFCPDPTTIEDWEYYGPPTREIIDTEYGYIGGFTKMCREYKNIDLVGILSPRGARGGSSGSWITQKAFDKYTGLITQDLEDQGPFDGVFISLHGAMAVNGILKPEAEIVRRVREAVGDIPIMVSLDLHANEDEELAEAADGVLIIKRYPHYDTTLIGERTARLMINTLRGNYHPVMAVRKPGVITPSVYQGTGVSPAMEIMERARRWECRHPGVYVSVAFGFAYADVPDVGATVMVVTNNDRELADRIADDMSDYIWRMRGVFAGKTLPKTQEGVSMALTAAEQDKTPVVLADHADRTGGSTHILAELIRQDASAFCIATLRDENAIAVIADNYQIGDPIQIEVGGHTDRFAGDPVMLDGILTFFGDYGRDQAAVISFGDNNHVILTPHLHQVTTTAIYEPLGIDTDSIDIFVLKSRVHFRRGYVENGFAETIIEVDAPGLGPADLSMLPYQNIPDDIYPLNKKK